MTRLSIIIVALTLTACGEPELSQPAHQPEHAAHQGHAAPTPAAEAPAAPAAQDVAIHTCPMHPEIRQEGPGSCPTCGMDLVVASEDPEVPMEHGAPQGREGHEGHDHHQH